jgi:hypothetical protein
MFFLTRKLLAFIATVMLVGLGLKNLLEGVFLGFGVWRVFPVCFGVVLLLNSY